MNFPTRNELNINYASKILEDIRLIDTDKIDFSGADFNPISEVKEKQSVYFWIRIYLNEEYDIEPNTDINIKYTYSGEVLTTKFICYSKKGLNKNMDENIINYNPEDDKKILCLMVDTDRINVNSSDIPFIRSLFKLSRFYSPQVIRLSELEIIDSKGNISFYDIDF